MSVSFSRSLILMFSSILWMLSLTGPTSTTCAPVGAMKRPSEVPPAVDNSVSISHTSRIAACAASTSSPRGVKNAWPDSDQSSVYLNWCLFKMASMRVCISVCVIWVEKRRLNCTSKSPGMTLVAPVPALMFDIWKMVGGKNSLPLSQCSVTKSLSAAENRWIGFSARWG